MIRSLAVLAAFLSFASPALAADASVSDLERKLDALSREVEQLKVGGAGASGSAASKWSFGGYGEFTVTLPSRKRQNADYVRSSKAFDARRIVFMSEYRFSDRWTFKSELEYEHASTGEGSEERGEIEIEQAFVDYRHSDALNGRIGHFIVPVGLVNLRHEPPVFHGVGRPAVEQAIIPSTWHENGAGLFGKAGMFEYQAYGLAGLKAIDEGGAPEVDGFSGANAIRGGRTGGSKSPVDDWAGAARLDARPFPGALVGVSGYIGNADQGLVPEDTNVGVSLWDAHAEYGWRGLELRGLYAQGRIRNAGSLNTQLAALAAPDPIDAVGNRFFGGYAEAAFNVLSLCPETTQYLAPFFRYERYDTQQQVSGTDPAGGGFSTDGASSRVDYTAGVSYRPISQIVFKLDHQWRRNQARSAFNGWQAGFGFMF